MRASIAVLVTLTTAVIVPQVVRRAIAGDVCTPPSLGPDVMSVHVSSHVTAAPVNGISGHAIGNLMCNVGDQPLPWVLGVVQNAYRLSPAGRFEQIGMSWVKKANEVIGYDSCCPCTATGDLLLMGVGCSDAYHAVSNGYQPNLGPRWAINPCDGFVPEPDNQPPTDGIDRRLQIRVADLDPAQNPGAKYFGEVQLVTPDDRAASNDLNNVSYTPLNVVFVGSAGTWGFSDTFVTTSRLPAIYAWKDNDPTVTITTIDVPDDGRFYLGHRTSDNGDGTWRYEYALFNQNSHRSARSFSVPISTGVAVSNIGFHDVDYHSGEPFDLTDWSATNDWSAVTWSTDDFAQNPNANALRWSTLYNFWFDAAGPPAPATATIGLFHPGFLPQITVQTMGPTWPVPTLSEHAGRVMAVAFLIAGIGALRVRRRRRFNPGKA